MGDFLYGQCSKGAGRTHNAIDLKCSLLDPTFRASSLHFPPPSPPPFSHLFILFIEREVILSYVRVWKIFQAVTLQQDQESARWLIFSVNQAARAVSEIYHSYIGYFTCLDLRCGIHPRDAKTLPYPHCTQTNHRGAILLTTNSVSQLFSQTIGLSNFFSIFSPWELSNSNFHQI